MKPRILSAFLLLAVTAAFAAEPAAPEISALERQAAAGDANAQNNLGARYEAGAGVAKDPQKALELYRQAANGGNAVGAYNLAVMYDEGTVVAKDQKVANEWYQKSADQGYPPAMLNLGWNLAQGEGATADPVEAMKWLDLARFLTQQEKDMRVKWAIRGAYDKLKERLTRKQMAEAEKRTRAWVDAYKAKHRNG